MTTDGGSVSVRAKVTNTGSEYPGKEVVQVYYSAPDGQIEKPYQELAAFAKTKLLLPGESEELTISWPIREMASYSEKRAAWVLEAGNYYIRVGSSSRTTRIEAALELTKEVVTEQLKNLFRDELRWRNSADRACSRTVTRKKRNRKQRRESCLWTVPPSPAKRRFTPTAPRNSRLIKETGS